MQYQLTLERTAFLKDQLQVPPRPEIGLAGRSNVGKSSLINCLAGRKQLAKTSATPGKTRSVNYYLAQPGDFYLVDLPGYGYAQASKSERTKWAALIDGYLRQNDWLRAVVVLLDSRLDPQANDIELLRYLNSLGVRALAVLTKCDKCNQRERESARQAWMDISKFDIPPLFFSSKTGMGRDKLWSLLHRTALGDAAQIADEEFE